MSVVKAVIDDWDPIELLVHSPNDEYHSEIEEIEATLKTCNDEIALANSIFDIFTRAFSETFTKSISECSVIAKRIMAIMHYG